MLIGAVGISSVGGVDGRKLTICLAKKAGRSKWTE
jgi:hypothetical protein